MQQLERQPLQRGLLVRHSGGCLSPRVLDFLCFDTPRSVLGGEEGEEELPFYLASRDSLEAYVRQVRQGGGPGAATADGQKVWQNCLCVCEQKPSLVP